MSGFPPEPPFLIITPALVPAPAPFTPAPLAPGADGFGAGCPGKVASSLGTISIRKSKWSDLVRALAISALDNVRRLLESATMKARPVISAINTIDKCEQS